MGKSMTGLSLGGDLRGWLSIFKRSFIYVMLIIVSVSCGGGDNTKVQPGKGKKKPAISSRLKGFQYKKVDRKLLILPTYRKKSVKSDFIDDLNTSIQNTMDNDFKLVPLAKHHKATKSQKKAMKYCAEAEADFVMVTSYSEHGEDYIYNLQIYAFEDNGKKRITRSLNGKKKDIFSEFGAFVKNKLRPAVLKRYPKVYKGVAPFGVKVLDKSPGGFPSWISHIPEDDKYQYFVGQVGNMPDRQRARREAMNEALWSIALSVDAVVDGVQKRTLKERMSGRERHQVSEFKKKLRVSTRVTVRGAREAKNYYRNIQLSGKKARWEYYVLMKYPRKKLIKKLLRAIKKESQKRKKYKLLTRLRKKVQRKIKKDKSSLSDHIYGLNGDTLDRGVDNPGTEPVNMVIQKGHNDFVYSVAFSPDGKTLASASASRDKTVKLWSRKGQLIKTLEGHKSYVAAVAFSPDGKTLASASLDNTVKLWNRKGKLIKTLEGHSNVVRNLAFSPDGKVLATGFFHGGLKLWKLKEKVFKTLKGHLNMVINLAYSPDGKILASASTDKTVKLWSRKGKLIKTLKGHSSGIPSVAFSPDGKILASASNDNTVKLWSRNGELIKTFHAKSWVSSIHFSPDGRFLVGASGGVIKKWTVQTGESLSMIALGKRDFVAYNDEGLFECSQGAKKYIHFVRGEKVYQGKEYWDMFYSPGLMSRFDRGRRVARGR